MSVNCPFEQNVPYRVKKSYQWGVDTVDAGQILVFSEYGHSAYDSMTIFLFKAQPGGEPVPWELSDGDSIDKWAEFFERV